MLEYVLIWPHPQALIGYYFAEKQPPDTLVIRNMETYFYKCAHIRWYG
jgi:hypothetical protein